MSDIDVINGSSSENTIQTAAQEEAYNVSTEELASLTS